MKTAQGIREAQHAMRARQRKERDRQRRVLLNLSAKNADLGAANSGNVLVPLVTGEMASAQKAKRLAPG